MRSVWERIGFSSLIGLIASASLLVATPSCLAQGGEPQYFAIRSARVVPVSGPPMDDATIIVARGVIVAVAKDATIPADAWVIEGKGLTVYPGLLDALTDVGLPPPAPPHAAEGTPRRDGEAARGPEDRPNSSPWRSSAHELSLPDKRIETWRSSAYTRLVSTPKPGS